MAVDRTTFPIAAFPEAVWDVLTDFERYPEWNPSLPSISEELRPGSTVSLTLAMPGRPKVKARLGDVEPGRRPTWHGTLERTGSSRAPARSRGSAIRRHHDALNVALTERAERDAVSTSP
jgi:uncharacterized protein YndB with AHSA1/START domain